MIRSSRRLLNAVKKVPTPLGELLHKQIEKEGPIPFALYMKEAMCHQEFGYFTTREKVIGGDADFITAPELLPEFGWCVARWLEQCVQATSNDTEEFCLVELGPGTGRLMLHLLMYIKYEIGTEFLKRVHLRMLEVSPIMITQQQQQLKPFAPDLASLSWGSSFEETFASLPSAPTYVTSNEYFDVLPVHIITKHNGVWKEDFVKSSKDSNGTPTFFLETGDHETDLVHYLVAGRKDELHAERLEVCPAAIDAVVQIGKRIEETGGAMLGIDYGKDLPSVNTLQGMSKQVTCSPLLNPGQIDISWHVDFSSLRDHLALACPTLSLTSAAPQATFLSNMGFDELYQQRVAQNGPLPPNLEYRYSLMMDKEQMGGYHRAVGMCRKDLYPPPGF